MHISRNGKAAVVFLVSAALAALAIVPIIAAASGSTFSLAAAAAPYKGMTITVVGLDRPSYAAAQKLTPQFEKETGINVKWVIFPYESTLKEETLNFVSNSQQFDVILTDVVWPGVFGQANWVVPADKFLADRTLTDPAFDVADFVPIWLKAFTWGDKLLGIPFDSYSGLLYYNKKMLADAGFTRPPATWDELLNVYAPKLTDTAKGVYAFALQSRRGETQSCDAFARFLWPWGGDFINPVTFQPDLTSAADKAGLEFRAKLMKFMPPGIVNDDHGEVVQLLAQQKVAMITEWSSFYATLKDPTQSKIVNDLGVTVEPAGPKGRVPAFGGFAYMVSTQIPEKLQNASWLFIEWLTSKGMAKPLVENGAVVARLSADTDPALQATYPYLAPMVESWKTTTDIFRPRFAEWPQLSEITSNWGTQIELGQVSLDQGLQNMSGEFQKVLADSGYYSDKKQRIE